MGLGGTAKKLQKVASMAEDLYKRMNEVVSELKKLRSDLEETNAQVDDLERQVVEQRAIIDAMAEAEGIDVDEVVADVEPAPVETESAEPEATASE